MNVKEFVKGVQAGKIDVVEHTKDALNEIGFIDNEHHFFNVVDKEGAIAQASNVDKKGKLAGVIVSVKDCICVKDMESRAGSKILSGYNPVFDATVISKLRAEGAIIVGKTAQDAFGFGSFTVNVGLDMKIPLNPFDKTRACGGSSGGSGGITQKASFPHISIGESTGGSIEAPASFCGVIGFCPTYGRVSRYGLIDYANSFDKIGPMSKSMYDIALTLEVISGYDCLDSTSLDVPVDKYTSFVGQSVKGLRVGLIKESIGEGVDLAVRENILEAVSKLKKMGVKVEEVSLPLTFKYGVSAYYLLAMCEASTNLSKLCGIEIGE